MSASAPVSLLHPAGSEPARLTWAANAVTDLGLDRLLNRLDIDLRHRPHVTPLFLQPTMDDAVITYRQEVLADLVDSPALAEALEAMLSPLADLADFRNLQTREASPLEHTVWRLRELNECVECVKGISAALAAAGELRSRALKELARDLAELQQAEFFQALERELPQLLPRLRHLSSVTVGLNLNDRMQFAEATLVSVNDEKFRGSGLLERLVTAARGTEYQGIGPLHSVEDRPAGLLGFALQGLTRLPEKPAARALIEDLNRIQGPIFQPVATALRQYVGVSTGLIEHLGPEIAFYAAAAKLVAKARAVGLPMCRPRVAPVEERACDLEGAYDIGLLERAKEGSVVLNDAHFGADARILILTGPNGGGKTTFTRAVGLNQMLFQVGLFTPAVSARMSPVDAILTHFPAEEKPDIDAGRLAEEAGRLSAIFKTATKYSLALLNESLASTSPGESLYMARDIVRGLRLLGARAIFNTHLHELAAGVPELNAEAPNGDRVVSVVAGAELQGDASDPTATHRRTFRIRPGPPVGLSYAREIASQHGISFEQIAATLAERGEA